jgi:hypothetical protein
LLDVRNGSFTGCNFEGANLYGVNFSGCDLSKSNFRDSNIKQANFAKTKMWACDITDTKRDASTLHCLWKWKSKPPKITRWKWDDEPGPSMFSLTPSKPLITHGHEQVFIKHYSGFGCGSCNNR